MAEGGEFLKKPLITFQNFSFTYSDQLDPVLNELNITLYKGEKVLIVGPSGSGKSTFARCLSGALPNSDNQDYTGSIIYGDGDSEKSITNFLPNELAISMEESAEMVKKKDQQFGQKPTVQPFQSYLEQKKRAGMKWFLDKYPNLSQGFELLSDIQFDKISAAGLYLNEAPMLIFDEPLANLDPKSGDLVMNFVDELDKKTDTTVILIEHRLEDALVCPIDRLLLFSDGRIIADGKPSDVLKTDILSDIGIREPLYITAMRYAGINLDEIEHLDDVHKVNGPNLKIEMEKWLSYLPHFLYPETEGELLELQNVQFKYPWNEKDVIHDVSLKIREGEMLSIIGPNQSGKTTLAKIIAGLETTKRGKILWKGQDITKFDQEQMENLVGYVPQDPMEYITQDSIYEEISYRLKKRNFPVNEINKRVEEAIRVCSLQYIRDLSISTLSFGQLRRVMIASILALSPEMIIVDEPVAGQDFTRYTEIMSFLQTIHLQGVTVLLVTNDIHLMMEYTKRAVVMTNGEIIADASPVYILVSPDIIEKASLKETSLYTFANQLGMNDPFAFTEKFVHYDRVARLF